MDDVEINVVVSNQARMEPPPVRTYLAFYYYDILSQNALLEDKAVYRFSNSNPIDVAPSAKKPDVVVLVRVDDQANQENLRKKYPEAQWAPVQEKPKESTKPILERVLIPADLISSNSHELFYFHEVKEGGWVRRFYDAQMGRRLGVIYAEDRAQNLRDPFPAGVPDICSGWFEREIFIEKGGKYSLSVEAGNDVVLNVDGKTVMKALAIHGTVRKSTRISLSKGIHRLGYFCLFRHGKFIPDIQVTEPGPDGQDSKW